MGDEERLPIVEGVRRNDLRALVDSVFYDVRARSTPGSSAYYERQFANRRWRTGLLRTIRGTMGHGVRDRLRRGHPADACSSRGREDRIVDPAVAPRRPGCCPTATSCRSRSCGHAPQMEKPWLINRLVVHFLTQPRRRRSRPDPQLLLARPNTIL